LPVLPELHAIHLAVYLHLLKATDPEVALARLSLP
jgi:hypothetical protein